MALLPFMIMLGSTLEFFLSSLHMFGQLLPVTERLLHSSNQHYCRRDRPALLWSGEAAFFGGLYCPFFYTVGAGTYTVLPPPTLPLGQMLPVLKQLASRFFTVLPLPLHYS